MAGPRNHLQSPIDSASGARTGPDNQLSYKATSHGLASRQKDAPPLVEP